MRGSGLPQVQVKKVKTGRSVLWSTLSKVDDLLLSFDLSEADKKKYKPLEDKFDLHFVIKKNVIYERAKFKMRS